MHSWAQYRKRRSSSDRRRGVSCGVDPCGPDACFGKADPYATIDLEIGGGRHYRLGRTHTIDSNHSPKWHREFSTIIDVDSQSPCSQDFESRAGGPNLIIRVLDDDIGGESYTDILGIATFPLKEVVQRTKPLRVSLSIRHPKAKPSNTASLSRIKIEFRWYPMHRNAHDPVNMSVPQTYFTRSHGNLVRLYHDAECLPGQFPNIETLTGQFEAHSAWHDVQRALQNAEHFIFVAGWSVNPAISLIRKYLPAPHNMPLTIGELLKRKANEGVSVCVLVWDDITSREGVSFLKDGIMATYDEYTREYFRDTPVEVAVVKRIAGDDVGEVSDLLKWISFTHHQKIVCYDTDHENKRIVGAFVGGLDLTSGRYDTADHKLFGTLKTAHANDFYNGCLVESTAETGPRQPWHDIHGRIEGPAAWDVLQTFLERIAKQAPKMVASTSGLINELTDSKLLKDGRKVLVHPNDPRSWDVQVFRSLDTEAAMFEDVRWTSKFANATHFVEKSIQQAYVHLINKARSFIYLENQYFLGSSQYWKCYDEVPCHNLVPYELTRRICEAIGEGERFVVYILIPLFPEGAPSSVSVQEILHWQYQTMCMMYERIGAKLEEVGERTMHPTDFLSFYFVGNREPDAVISNVPNNLPTDLANAIANRRHPIYIHSKMMMIDDEYILMGSANINERSMAGCRDTEIAFGALQPASRLVRSSITGKWMYPKGDVRAFRLHLWHEHLGSSHYEEFNDPSSLSCIRKVNELAQKNYAAYSSSANQTLPHGHMCPYPLQIDQDGSVKPLGTGEIIGWTAPVIGTKSALLPGSLTT